jgi:hypothetical protein
MREEEERKRGREERGSLTDMCGEGIKVMLAHARFLSARLPNLAMM